LTYDLKRQSFVVNRVDIGIKIKGPNQVIIDNIFNNEDEDFDPMQVAMNFKWENDFTFRIVNKEGFEKLISIQSGEAVIKDSTFVPMKNLLSENSDS
jgi:hypothetical protein